MAIFRSCPLLGSSGCPHDNAFFVTYFPNVLTHSLPLGSMQGSSGSERTTCQLASAWGCSCCMMWLLWSRSGWKCLGGWGSS